MTYTNLTNEELVSIITETADNDAYAQLFRNLAPITPVSYTHLDSKSAVSSRPS